MFVGFVKYIKLLVVYVKNLSWNGHFWQNFRVEQKNTQAANNICSCVCGINKARTKNIDWHSQFES